MKPIITIGMLLSLSVPALAEDRPRCTTIDTIADSLPVSVTKALDEAETHDFLFRVKLMNELPDKVVIADVGESIFIYKRGDLRMSIMHRVSGCQIGILGIPNEMAKTVFSELGKTS